MGRNKSGLSTKTHATHDVLGNPTGFHLMTMQDHNLDSSDPLINRLMQVASVLVDKSYDVEKRLRTKLCEKGCEVIILF